MTQIIPVFEYLVKSMPIGTNLALLNLMWAIASGAFLSNRGSVHGALATIGLDKGEIQRGWRVLRYGVWSIEELLLRWNEWVMKETQWQPRKHGQWQAVGLDITTFWRPKLKGWKERGYHQLAGRLLPGVALGVVVRVGEIGQQRIPLLKKLVRAPEGATDEAGVQARLLKWAVSGLQLDEVAVLDGGFKLTALQAAKVPRFLVRMAVNCTLRHNVLPPKKGVRGANPKYGLYVRPLARKYKENEIAATKPMRHSTFTHQDITVKADGWSGLVRSDQKVNQEHPTVVIWVFHDPRYKSPLVVATNLDLSAHVAYQLYRDRWPVEQPPLVAKQTLGLHRMFVHAHASVRRLPELALFVANVMTIIAATLPAIPTGFWDTHPKKTAGRLSRSLRHVNFSDLTLSDCRIRKKASVTHHLPKGNPRYCAQIVSESA